MVPTEIVLNTKVLLQDIEMKLFNPPKWQKLMLESNDTNREENERLDKEFIK